MKDGFQYLAGHPWLSLGLSAVLAVSCGLLLDLALVRILKRNAQPSSSAGIVLRSAQPALAPVLVLIGLLMVWHGAADSLPYIEALRRFTSLLLILSLSLLAARAVDGMGEAIIRRNPYDIEDNYRARGILTQSRVLTGTLSSLIVVLGLAASLMVFPKLRELGAGLLASAGVLGIAVGLAAKPMIGNLLAGLQLAFTQPIRLDDVVIVEGEWGRIEEITRSYVVIKIWDERRLIVPLQYFIEHPFQNWTRGSADILGTVFLWVDYGTPVEPLRQELARLCERDLDWDRRVAMIQVTETSERAMQLRVLLSSSNAARNFDLRCRVREGLLDYLRRECPRFLPTLRSELRGADRAVVTAAD